MSFVNVLDPRLKMESADDAVFVVKTGPTASYTVLPPQNSPLGANNLVYQLNAVGPNVGRNRLIYVRCTGSFLINGSFSALPSPGQIGFKCAPFNRSCQSVQHTLNGVSETYNNNQIIDFITRIKSSAQEINRFDNFQPDTTSDFQSASLSPLSPIVPYFNVSVGDVQKSRTVGITGVSVSAGTLPTATQITVSFDFVEPLITPFSGLDNDLPALYGLDGENININFIGNGLSDALCFNVGTWASSVSSIVCNLQSASLSLEYITGRNLVLPSKALYQFPKYQVFQTGLGNIASNSSITGTVQVNSQTVPSKLVIFARPPEQNRTPLTPDAYLSLNQIQVQIDNGLTLLQSMTQKQLWDASTKNGLCMPYALWNQQNVAGWNGSSNIWGAGSVLILDPVKDLSLSSTEGLTVGSAGKYTINLTCNFTNNTGSTVNSVNLYCFIVNDALLIRDGRNYSTSYLSFTPEQVENAKNNASMVETLEKEHAHRKNLFLSGGGIASTLKTVGKFALQNKDELLSIGKATYGAYSKYKTKHAKGAGMERNGLYMEYA